MDSADVEALLVNEPTPAPALPDYVLDADAVLRDTEAAWRYGRPPNYSNTRKVYGQSKKMSHEPGSLESIVENLVKNWEIEASFKTSLADWRTIDHKNYSFSVNGGRPQTGEEMLKCGTYNAIISPNEFYSPEHSDFTTSHKTFKRMMPTFAWEVLEVYSGPPRVAFKWRHWGTMKNDYVGFNNKGEKVTVKAHGGPIDIEGITVAKVTDDLKVQNLETWFDPMDMFRQIAVNGIINKEINPIPSRSETSSPTGEADINSSVKDITLPGTINEDGSAGVDGIRADASSETIQGMLSTTITTAAALTNDEAKDSVPSLSLSPHPAEVPATPEYLPTLGSATTETETDSETKTDSADIINIAGGSGIGNEAENGSVMDDGGARVAQAAVSTDAATTHSLADADTHTSPLTTSEETHNNDQHLPTSLTDAQPGDAIAAPPESHETFLTHEELGSLTPSMCPFLNKE
ncbi:hypothetical protein L228DRAFT_120694 [Xylona heveae TC161]|uniref:Pathogen-related protein n=1 Tax=Xylona heveae (strain CBS 132557 / TC161) TaxID=1328760 RepID=A0A165HJN6_XYLHT|nr:hypothetical protein L228DRAFT_120694 [Xylona heveae TC161]KZF23613.1 hypothetical protein L228DRAFT_120694 [Xylona heveae TC161]